MVFGKKERKDHHEAHLITRSNWLRAAILGANDGILSIGSILIGMVEGHASSNVLFLAGLAGLVAGATSMATGEYVSVSSQCDIEGADLQREQREIDRNPKFEQEELAQIYATRGLDVTLAREVARQLMVHDALGAHALDELGISAKTAANPIQAALTSAASFSVGGVLPLLTVTFAPSNKANYAVVIACLLSLAILGALGARTSGVAMLRPTIRVVFWGALSMTLTGLVGSLFGISP
jgi:VIT1/CCC1 family predicted Fe2+/Mn2+ transporter